MKTNKILVALALPALFAACTAEEIEVASVQQETLAGRALLDPNFAINVNEGVESRFAWDNMVWSYEDGDQFGAAIVDPVTLDDLTSGKMLGNYVFAKNEAGEWKTTSQMTEGTYLYYSYDGFETKASRDLVAFDFRNQKANLKDADAELNKYENQLFISPLYKLVEKYSAEKLPLTFYSFAGVGAFPMTNNSGQDLKITQIILRGDDGAAGDMIVKGYVDPSALAAAKYEFYADSAKYIPSAAAALLKAAKTAGTTADAEAVDACYTAAKDALLNNQAATTTTTFGTTSKYITLDCQNYLLKDGASVTPYMMVPAGMTNMSVEIMVVDEEGEAWSVYVKDADADSFDDYDGTSDDEGDVAISYMNSIKTKRDKTNAIFGKTNDNKAMKSIKIKSYNLKENSGYYVDSKDALIKLLDGNLGKIKVHNSGDWAIDKDIVKAILNYSGAGIQFTNPIKIKSTAALTAEDELALKGVTFADVTVVGTEYEEGTTTVTFAGTTAELNVTVNGTLTVEAGANVTLVGGSYKNIVNHGTLAVKSLATINSTGTTVNKAGTITLYKNAAVAAETGTVKFLAWEADEDNAYEVNSRVDLTAGANLEIGQYITLSGDVNETDKVTIKADDTNGTSKLTNNGIITKYVRVYGQFENNGKVTGAVDTMDDGASVTNSADAVIEGQFGLMEGASVTNNGLLKNVAMFKGEITTGADSETIVKSAKKGVKINNTDLGIITEGVTDALENVEIYYNFAGTVTELEAISFKWFNINTLRLTGELSFTRNFDQTNTAALEQLAELKKLVMAEGASINVKTDLVAATFNEIELEGNATIKGIRQEVSNLHLFADNDGEAAVRSIPVKMYNEAVTTSGNTKTYGHILTISGIKLWAYEGVAANADADTEAEASKFVVSAYNEAKTSSQTLLTAKIDQKASEVHELEVAEVADNTKAAYFKNGEAQ